MFGRYAFFAGAALGVTLLFCWNQARAVITAKTPLKAIVASSAYIVVGKVIQFFPEKPAMMLSVVEDIKGKAPFRSLPVNLKVADEKTSKANQIGPLLRRFGPELEVIFFLSPIENDYITFAFTNGTWFQLQGSTVGKKDEVVFSLKSAEPYFRKSFKGTTEELRKLLKDHAATKTKLPPLDDKVEPGLGPEYAPKQKSERMRYLDMWIAWNHSAGCESRGSLFAVIPTIGLGAPLAILALLFPTIFGGVFVLFRQWMAFITLISLNSTLLLVQWGFVAWLPDGSWWSTPAAVWFLMSMFTFACAFWAWRRQLNALSNGEVEAPPKTELAVLAFMTASCVVTTLVLWYITPSVRWADVGWSLTVVMTLGIVAGTIYRGWNAYQKPAPFGSMPLATEGVILGAMLLGHVAIVPAIFGVGVATAGTAEGKQQSGNLTAKVAPVEAKWIYTAPENIFGMFASSPLIAGDSIYASYSTALQRATMIRLDRQTGFQKWAFSKIDLRQMISSPCLAEGKLYFGEGFHDDANCHVYCIDADSGKQIWRFKTEGQTESSPTVAHGKVYIGAGNVGVYALDAKDGAVNWKYPPDNAPGASDRRLLRFCGGMVVVGNRLYCGSGVDRNKKGKDDKGETALFCLDTNTGTLLWKTPAPYPVWSTPVVKKGMLYVTSGNGDVFTDVPAPEKPGGALQCIDAQTGKEQWCIKFENGIIEAPAVDAHRIYFGCRDGQLYCINRADGKERWRYFLESPIIATPVLDSDPVYERTVSVFAMTTAGKVCCMNPHTGDIVWRFDLSDKRAAISTSPRLVVTPSADGYTRQLYFGCGLGGGAEIYENRPVFYCLEDKVKVE